MTRKFGNNEGNRVLNQFIHIFTKLDFFFVFFFVFFLCFFPFWFHIGLFYLFINCCVSVFYAAFSLRYPVNTWTTAYYLKEHPSKRLFCLLLEEMDPTSCAIELSGSNRFFPCLSVIITLSIYNLKSLVIFSFSLIVIRGFPQVIW